MIDLHYWPTPTAGRSPSCSRMRAALQDRHGEHRHGRAVQAGVPEDQPQQHACRPLSTTSRGRWRAGVGVRIGRDPAVPAEKSGKFCAKDLRGKYEVLQWVNWQMGGLGPMAGQANTSTCTRTVQSGRAAQVRAGPLQQRGQSPVRCAEQAAGRPRPCRRRLLDRRHGDLAVGVGFKNFGQKLEDFPTSRSGSRDGGQRTRS